MAQTKEEPFKEIWIDGSHKFSEFTTSKSQSSQAEIDESLATLQVNKENWARLPIRERIILLDKSLQGMMGVANRWVYGALDEKQAPANSLAEAEEWVSLAIVFRALHTIKRSLIDIRKQGWPRIPGPARVNQDGQAVVRVFPLRPTDRFLFLNFTGELWLEPGTSLEEMINTQASSYREDKPQGKIALVLGAGNASFLPVIDMLHKLFLDTV